MKKLIYVLVPATIVILYFSLSESQSDESYIEQIQQAREEQIRFLKSSAGSPFVNNEVQFKAPSFFEIDPGYRVNARLERIDRPSQMIIQNSDGSTSYYRKYAYATFTLKGEQLRLLVLKPDGFGAMPNTYFTAFADETSGESTYGGGRYLDPEIGKSDKLTIDFNLAYNPYCAYVKDYTCPLPPAENTLPIAIRAGEKDYKE